MQKTAHTVIIEISEFVSTLLGSRVCRAWVDYQMTSLNPQACHFDVCFSRISIDECMPNHDVDVWDGRQPSLKGGGLVDHPSRAK